MGEGFCWIDAQQLRGGDERIEACDLLSGVFVSDEELLFFWAKGETVQRVLGAVVVRRQCGDVEKTRERFAAA